MCFINFVYAKSQEKVPSDASLRYIYIKTQKIKFLNA